MIAKRFPSDESGFTLIEVLMAIAIFSIGLMAVGMLQARSLMNTGDIARRTEAWTIVDEQASLLKALPFYTEVWPTPPATHPAGLTVGNYTATHLPSGRYDVHWLVEDDTPLGQVNATLLSKVPAGTYTACKRITVQVTPVGGNTPADTLAQVQFVKTWAATGIP